MFDHLDSEPNPPNGVGSKLPAAGTTEKSRQFEEQSNIERTFVTASDPVGSIRFTDPKAATAAAVLHKKGLNSTIGGAVRYHPANVPFRHRRVANAPISRPGTLSRL